MNAIFCTRAGRALFLTALVGLFDQPRAFALDPHRAITQYLHTVWDTSTGLAQRDVYGLAQTADGYLWVGTIDGLVRFDGVRFTVFDKSNTPAIQQNYIKALQVDRRGVLWIATFGGGVVTYGDGRFAQIGRAHV